MKPTTDSAVSVKAFEISKAKYDAQALQTWQQLSFTLTDPTAKPDAKLPSVIIWESALTKLVYDGYAANKSRRYL